MLNREENMKVTRRLITVGFAAVMAAGVAMPSFEAFWSAAPVPDPVKWAVAGVNTLFVIAHLSFAGRNRERRA